MVEVQSAGIDTWSPCWYVGEDSPAAQAMAALATQPTARGRLIPEAIDEHRVGWFPSSNLVYAEGHPSANGLGSPAALVDRLEALRSAIGDVGVPLPRGHMRDHWDSRDRTPGLAGVRRLDVTVDLVGDAAVGCAVLAGIAALQPGRADVVIRRGGRGIETVAWMGARGLLARAYDKGVESGSHARGERTRLEGQYRWAAGMRRDPAELSATYVRDKFVARFAPLWKASEGVKVVGTVGLVDELKQRVEGGDLTMAQAEQVLAFQLFAAAPGAGYNERTRRRRQALVRETGLVMAGGALEEVEVDLHAVLGAVLDTDAWEREG